ncbi:hypothetical protein HMPREF9069_01689 [Atopobium sp. oral taxon 810 str. F0209]|nr:hypothetical protein HMPREF9069_01689 [Atopobium sp. oral taxon 810 str. F0209]
MWWYVALLAYAACQTPHTLSINTALPVKATDSFKQSSSACQKPQILSEKMSKATDLFNGLHVFAGRFFGREEMCGFWLKK